MLLFVVDVISDILGLLSMHLISFCSSLFFIALLLLAAYFLVSHFKIIFIGNWLIYSVLSFRCIAN